MKVITNIARVLVGLLFIFSGFIKLNDPTGFSYKLDEYFSIFAGDLETKQDSLLISFTGPENEIPSENKIQLFRNSSSISVNLSSNVEEKITYDTLESGQIDSSVNINVDLYSEGQLLESHVIPYKFDTLWDEKVSVYVKASINGKTLHEEGVSLSDKLLRDTTSRGRYTSEKAVDVTEYVKSDPIWVGFFLWLKNFVLELAIFLCVVEIILGIALLIGWQSRFTSWMLLLMILAFTFLTWYSWTYNKVTDCGCFGDCIPLEPKESFFKDVILSVLILIIVLGAKRIRPLFSNPFSVKILTAIGVLSTAYGIYCYTYLPVIDCLYWKTDTNFCELMEVPEGERESDHKIMTYTYEDSLGNSHEVIYDTDKKSFSQNPQKGWKYIGAETETLEEAYEPPIHDFRFMTGDGSNDYIADFLSQEKKLLAVFENVNKTNTKSLKKLNELAAKWKEEGYQFWALTASSAEEAEAFRHEHQLNFDFYFGDNTNLKSIIRSNPGLILITDTCHIENKWPSRRIPDFDDIKKQIE